VSTFRIETERQSGQLMIRLFGAFDLSAFEQVDELLAAAQLDGDSDVLVDLRSLGFIDSSGIRALLGAHGRAEAIGARFRLIRGPEPVQRVMELTGLDRRLHFVDGP